MYWVTSSETWAIWSGVSRGAAIQSPILANSHYRLTAPGAVDCVQRCHVSVDTSQAFILATSSGIEYGERSRIESHSNGRRILSKLRQEDLLHRLRGGL